MTQYKNLTGALYHKFIDFLHEMSEDLYLSYGNQIDFSKIEIYELLKNCEKHTFSKYPIGYFDHQFCKIYPIHHSYDEKTKELHFGADTSNGCQTMQSFINKNSSIRKPSIYSTQYLNVISQYIIESDGTDLDVGRYYFALIYKTIMCRNIVFAIFHEKHRLLRKFKIETSKSLSVEQRMVDTLQCNRMWDILFNSTEDAIFQDPKTGFYPVSLGNFIIKDSDAIYEKIKLNWSKNHPMH